MAQPTIIVAPFSNSDIRDWPLANFAGAIEHLVGMLDDSLVRVIGTANQRLRAHEIVRGFPSARVLNDCGRLEWEEVVAQIRAADVVIGNNSGIAHLSAYFGVPTVCVFGGSHQRLEWRPIGPNVVVISRVIACSPCHLDHNTSCKYDKACLRELQPSTVAAAALSLMKKNTAAGQFREASESSRSPAWRGQ